MEPGLLLEPHSYGLTNTIGIPNLHLLVTVELRSGGDVRVLLHAFGLLPDIPAEDRGHPDVPGPSGREQIMTLRRMALFVGARSRVSPPVVPRALLWA